MILEYFVGRSYRVFNLFCVRTPSQQADPSASVAVGTVPMPPGRVPKVRVVYLTRNVARGADNVMTLTAGVFSEILCDRTESIFCEIRPRSQKWDERTGGVQLSFTKADSDCMDRFFFCASPFCGVWEMNGFLKGL